MKKYELPEIEFPKLELQEGLKERFQSMMADIEEDSVVKLNAIFSNAFQKINFDMCNIKVREGLNDSFKIFTDYRLNCPKLDSITPFYKAKKETNTLSDQECENCLKILYNVKWFPYVDKDFYREVLFAENSFVNENNIKEYIDSKMFDFYTNEKLKEIEENINNKNDIGNFEKNAFQEILSSYMEKKYYVALVASCSFGEYLVQKKSKTLWL